MNEKIIKALKKLGRIKTIGKEVYKGYKPDLVLKCGRISLIVELESKTDRKAFNGDVVKAEQYAFNENLNLTLLIVITQKHSNTTVNNIAVDLRRFAVPILQRAGRKAKGRVKEILVWLGEDLLLASPSSIKDLRKVNEFAARILKP